MVVPVLMTSCHVSLKWKSGPVMAQTSMIATAMANVAGLPVMRAVNLAKRVNHDFDFVGLISFSPSIQRPEHATERGARDKKGKISIH